MGLKSFLLGSTGLVKRLQKEVAELKEAKRALKVRVTELKARPPRRPLDSDPNHEAALKSALQALATDAGWAENVRAWPNMAERVSSAVSECDIMLVKSHARAYAEVGLSALACVQAGLTAAGKADPARVLDFGCGFGRVLRFLRAAYPAAEVYCTDMDAEGLGFCTHHFNTFGVRTDLNHGPEWVTARFDLIWVGSVFTHLDVPNCERLLKHLAAFLAPGGLVVFTTHGEHARKLMQAGSPAYRLKPEVLGQILTDCESTGHGYADYPNWPGYGVSAMTTAWVDGLIAGTGLIKRAHLAAGWAKHQDVFVAERV
jgi:2-polyprenyl-3-methyl-5-hydroxy-6-metoxy-1,4-benzoquinol methylase